jgi:hypothetical protein
LDTVESYAEETPSCWKYASIEDRKVKSLRWINPKPIKKNEKQEVGPGKYAEGVAKAMAKTMTSGPKYSFPKSKSRKNASTKGIQEFTPGVGSYKNADTAFFKHLKQKTRAAVILPYKLQSFTDSVVKRASQVPGPGAYSLVPELKK